jgi:hypothetical protein
MDPRAPRAQGRACRRSGLNKSPRKACFRKWNHLRQGRKSFALCGEDLFYSFVSYVLQ